ncbi:MAG: STAS domain-containing protein [Spirochaetes bacterium]|nr:STAS domain-containing protein [Spirochaetota bacterium]
MAHTNLLSFPPKIDFETAAKYIELVTKNTGPSDLIIDLQSTEVVNSSFIGLLIYLKHNRERYGGKLIIKMSPSIEKILRQLGLYEYFTIGTLNNKSQSLNSLSNTYN